MNKLLLSYVQYPLSKACSSAQSPVAWVGSLRGLPGSVLTGHQGPESCQSSPCPSPQPPFRSRLLTSLAFARSSGPLSCPGLFSSKPSSAQSVPSRRGAPGSSRAHGHSRSLRTEGRPGKASIWNAQMGIRGCLRGGPAG